MGIRHSYIWNGKGYLELFPFLFSLLSILKNISIEHKKSLPNDEKITDVLFIIMFKCGEFSKVAILCFEEVGM